MYLISHILALSILLLSFVGAQFAKPSGLLFALDGTNPERFAGINSWYLTGHTVDADIDSAFQTMNSSGLKVVRVWGFRTIVNRDPRASEVWFQRLDSANAQTGTPAKYVNNVDGETGLKRLDVVLDMAQKWGLKVIIVFANYFADLGGIPSYNQAFGGDRTTWWTDQTSQAAYRDHIKTLVNRYRYRCEIFAWELMNEPRCEIPDNKGCDPNIITTWANDTSAWIKAPAPDGLGDNNHMVSLGDEGWFHPNNLPPTDSDASYPYQGAQGIDTVAVLDINTIDFGTFHFYPIYYKKPDPWGITYVKQHSDIAVAANKPVICEEYGKGDSLGQRAAIIGPWQQAMVESKLAADFYWQLGGPWTRQYTGPDVNTVYPDDPDYTALVTDHAAAISGQTWQ